MISTGYDDDAIVVIKSNLTLQFEMKDLGSICYFLSIEVAYSPKSYLLSQLKYAPTFDFRVFYFHQPHL